LLKRATVIGVDGYELQRTGGLTGREIVLPPCWLGIRIDNHDRSGGRMNKLAVGHIAIALAESWGSVWVTTPVNH